MRNYLQVRYTLDFNNMHNIMHMHMTAAGILEMAFMNDHMRAVIYITDDIDQHHLTS